MKRISFAVVVVLSLVAGGCGKSNPPGTTAEGTAPGTLPTAAIGAPQAIGNAPVVAKDAGPDVVVATFLDAARSGSEKIANELLTSKAREETSKEGLTVDPPGTPTMKYKIEKVEYLEDNKDAAYVNSIWTESSVSSEDSFEVVWVLRKQPDGWRIAGMAAQMVPEEAPVFLNFEDPADVQRIKSQVNAGDPGAGDPSGNTAAAPAAPGASPANPVDSLPAAQAQRPLTTPLGTQR